MMKTLLTSLLLLLTVFTASAQIRVNQTLQITIQGVPPEEQARLNTTVQVSSSGTFNMWEIGVVRAAGLTPDALGRNLSAAYKARGIYTNPTFHVMAPSDNGLVNKMFTVGGEVKGSGPKPYSNGMTLFGAIQAAGGETPFGAITRVKLYRNGKVRTFNLKNDQDKGFQIRPDDMIEVPQKNWMGR
ncbi:MAG: polysaccharide biosynthesis/export family protein [Verrucomicrobiaceae bacterium]